MPRQQLADSRHAAVELVDVGVDLRPVARADDEGPRDVLRVEDVAQQLAERVAAHHRPLERGERCALVAEADHEHDHVAIACASGSVSSFIAAAMSAARTDPSPPRRPACGVPQPCSASPPTRPTARRWAWNARICNSIDRSTLRTSTPEGTLSTMCAKFRSLAPPAATSRSQTSWAAAPGVAITPIETSCLLATDTIPSA